MAGERLVVIDDDPDICDALTLILGSAGYQVRCCTSGPEGVAAIRADPPDLVLLDIMLATPSEGFDLARELRRDAALRRIPIIVISAVGTTLGLEYVKELGADQASVERFIDKPLTAAGVLGAVREVLAQHRDPGSGSGDQR